MRTSDMIVRANPGQSLTMEEMRRSLPSIFQHVPHESRSQRYVYISTEDMLKRFMDGGFVPVEGRTALSRDPGRRAFAKHMLRFRSKDDLDKPENTKIKVGDVAYEVILRNAHDGSGSYQLLAGLFRYVCTNGMVVSDGTVEMIKVLHQGNPLRLLENVYASAVNVVEQGPRVSEKIKTWKQIELEPTERLEFARAAHRARFADADGKITTAIQPEQLILPRRPADMGQSLWKVFNVIQENSIRGGISADGTDSQGRRRRFTARAVNGIDQDVQLNRRLWQLAERVGVLKQDRKPVNEKALELEVA